MTITDRGFTSSTKYKHENACGLFSRDHSIPDRFAEVLDEIKDKFEDEVEVASVGCGNCFTTSRPLALFYVAQDPKSVDSLYLKFDSDGNAEEVMSRYNWGRAICNVADSKGVKWSWNGDTANAVSLGIEDGYDQKVDL